VEQTTVKHLKQSFYDLYGQQVRQVEPIRYGHVYLVLTSSDYYVIKYFKDWELLSWQARCVSQLMENKIRGIVPFIPNRHRSVINQAEEVVYGVMPYIPGKQVSLKLPNQRRDGLRLLATFHRGGKGIYGRRPSLSSRSMIYQHWQERLMQFKQSIQDTYHLNEGSDGLLDLARKYSSELIWCAELALDRFPQAFMLYLEEQAQWERQIAHRDIVGHNMLVIDDKYYYLIDYDRMDYAPPYVDIIQFFQLCLPYVNWQYNAVEQLLEVYGECRPLSKEEKKYLPIMLLYPADLIREWFGVWNCREGYHPKEVWRYFQDVAKQWEKRKEFVRTCVAMIK
jgi:Ser/Thr protein kinase RdoA (MazF antagonist)